MTFYWWSHWFWITLFSFSYVNTFPSQEFSSELNRGGDEKSLKAVTKLYQTTASLTWSTSVSPDLMDKTILKSIPSTRDLDALLDAEEVDVEADLDAGNLDDTFNIDEDEINDKSEEERIESSLKNLSEDYKRSAEVISKTKQNLDLEFESSKEGSLKVLKTEDVETISGVFNQSNVELLNPNKTAFINNKVLVIEKKSNKNEALRDEVKASIAAPSTPQIVNSNHSMAFVNISTQAPTMGNNSSEVVEEFHKVPFTLENVNRDEEIRRADSEHRTRKPKVLSADYKNLNRYINFSSQTKSLLTRSASTEANQYDENNIASEALSVQRTYFLDASAISAICLTLFGFCCTVGTIGIFLYRRRYLNKPQTLSEPDSSVYIDDSTLRISDNSEEMYSLDNDSFLNSLEAMTIQNYWTDTVKHTKL